MIKHREITKYARQTGKDPRKVLDLDFLIEILWNVDPYGIYNIGKNYGFINLSTSHDTTESAISSMMQQ